MLLNVHPSGVVMHSRSNEAQNANGDANSIFCIFYLNEINHFQNNEFLKAQTTVARAYALCNLMTLIRILFLR